MNTDIEDKLDRNNDLLWWLAGGGILLGACCLVSLATMLTLAFAGPSVAQIFERVSQLQTTPQPGISPLTPDTLIPTEEAFEYPSPDDNSLGDPNAPLKIVEFVDFQCSYCTRFWRDVEKDFLRDYVATGKVHFTYRALIVIGPESSRAAQAAYCAGDQEQFWQYHDILFTHQTGENNGAFSDENLIAFARATGLDGTQFAECLNSDKYADRVARDDAEARQAGAKATPSFLLNDILLEGAMSYEEFARIIDDVLQGNFQDFPQQPGESG
jgi:protein-disulfide isomerase